MTRRGFVSLLVAVMLLCAVPIARAQMSSEAPLRLALMGHDPVAYFTDGKPMLGKPEFEMAFDGARYRFTSAENMAHFKADPDKYAPQFAGACTNGLSQGFKIEANPELWRIVDGKLFVFYGFVPDEMATNPRSMIARAGRNWKTLAGEPLLDTLPAVLQHREGK